MELSDKQISLISSLISEGISIQNGAAKSKSKYLNKVRNELISIYNERKNEIPSWVEIMEYPVISVRECDNQIDPLYPDKYVMLTIQLLKDIRTEYYLDHQLQESHKQTCWTLCAFIVSLATLIATIIIPCACK